MPAFDEFERQLALELDFGTELGHMTVIADAVLPHYAEHVAVPRPLPHLSTSRVLTMESMRSKVESGRP